MDAANPSPISTTELSASLRTFPPPTLVDVRSDDAFAREPRLLPTAFRRSPEAEAWADRLEPWRPVVAYCAHGRELSRNAAAELAQRGFVARYLEGGLEAWRAARGALENARPPTRWVTRERPKIDRIACPWLIARFIDAEAEFIYVPRDQVLAAAEKEEAIPYDIPGAHFGHEGDRCSFDAFLAHYRLRDPALDRLAVIVRGADTGKLELSAQAPGLLAISQGLSRNFQDDHEMLKHGMVMYDALYTWCKEQAVR
jgi:rhodanese-related sulfurtransferase